MPSKSPDIHRLNLSRLVVEGNLQHIILVATLTLKDEKPDKGKSPDKHIMQVHVDGSTLAQWDLGMIRERKLTGSDKFFTITEQKMLQLTLPLFDKGSRKVASMKTIQLFILSVNDFHIAVDYLSTKAGMQHCHINQVLQNLRGTSVPGPAPLSRPRDATGMSRMRPPTAPPRGRPMRPQSQTAVQGPVRYSPLEPVYRPQTARPILTHVPRAFSHATPTPGFTGPIGRRPSSQEHRFQSGPLVGPLDHRNAFAPGGFGHPRQLLSTGSGDGDLGGERPLYNYPVHPYSMGSHTLSQPLQHDVWGPSPFNAEVGTDTGNELDGPYQTLPAAHRTVSISAGPSGRRPSSQRPTSRPASRSSPFSDHGVPIRIEVVSLPEEPRLSRPDSETRWGFTLHLLPATKIWQLCLHAAGYIHREYRATVDNKALAARSMDGTLLKDHDRIPDETLQGGTIQLVERRILSTAQLVRVNSKRSKPEPLHLGQRSEAAKLDGPHLASPPDPFLRAIDEADQVPPPRQLPFRVAPSAPLPPSSSSTAAAQPPLRERPDLVNAKSRLRPDQRSAQSESQDTRTEVASTKQPNNSQKRPVTTSRRPASSASGRKAGSVAGAANSFEPQISVKRPETSLGIRRKRKAPSGDGGRSAPVPPVIGPPLSHGEASAKELSTTACMCCRLKKRKCDRSKPACGPCLKDQRPCTYPNIQKAAATGHSEEKARNGASIDVDAHPMTLRSQALASPSTMSGASTPVCHQRGYRDIGSQTQGTAHEDQDVEMKDVGTDPSVLYTDASMETDNCDDLWVAFSQVAPLVPWAGREYETQVQKAAKILSTTDASHDDYQEKVDQAAVCASEFEDAFREKYEQTSRRQWNGR